MIDQNTGRRIRASYGKALMMVDGKAKMCFASPQIITHATAEKWKKQGRVAKNRIIVSG